MVSYSAELSLIFHALLLLAPTITIVRDGSMDWSKNITNYLCPYTDFCLTKALKVFNYPARNHAPCCSDCSCTNDCIETNSCCPDKTMVSHNSTGPDKTMVSHNCTGLVCKNTMVKKRGGLKDDGNHDGYADGIKRYLITVSCPTSEQDKIIHHKCLGIDKTTLGDYVWVSDAATGRIYQNYHCAQCHGIKTWKNWNIRTLCSRITDDSFQNLTETLFSEECNIINEVSEELATEAEEYRCYKPTITVCNQTGQWQQYDAAVDEACKRNTVPFFQIDEKLLKMVIYNNLFCYVCNTDAIDNADMVCPSIKGDNRISPTSFSALIDFMEGQEDTKMAASACEINQIYDKYAGICRKLLCPFGQRPYDGHCKPQTVTMNNLGVWVQLNLIIDWEQTKLPNESMVDPISFANGERIVVAITKEMKAKSCACCSMHLTMSDATIPIHSLPNFDLLLSFSTNPKCQYENIHKSIDVAIGKVIKITFKDRDPIFIKPHYDKRSRSTLSQLKTDTLFYFRSGLCKAEVEPRTPFCPGIELNYSEVQSINNQKVKRMLDQLFDSGNVNDTSTVFICLSEYFNIVAPRNAAVRIQMFWSAALIMLKFL